MAWYRQIDMRVWGDAKFCELSDGAKLLWFYILTGPHTTSLPGLYHLGKGAVYDGFRIVPGTVPDTVSGWFEELTSKGMLKADFKAHVVWLPNAIRYNPPANVNIVKGWAKHVDLIPECSLKTEALSALTETLERLGKPFAEPFREPFGDPYRTQEQEQEQELNTPPNPPRGRKGGRNSKPREPPEPSANGEHRTGACFSFSQFWDAYPRKVAKGPAYKVWEELWPNQELGERILAAIAAQKKSDEWKIENGKRIPNAAKWLGEQQWENEIATAPSGVPADPARARQMMIDACERKAGLNNG